MFRKALLTKQKSFHNLALRDNKNYAMGSPRDSAVKNLPAMQKTQEMQVQYLGKVDSLEKKMATHSSISCLKNPMDRGTGWARVQRVARSRTQQNSKRTH